MDIARRNSYNSNSYDINTNNRRNSLSSSMNILTSPKNKLFVGGINLSPSKDIININSDSDDNIEDIDVDSTDRLNLSTFERNDTTDTYDDETIYPIIIGPFTYEKTKDNTLYNTVFKIEPITSEVIKKGLPVEFETISSPYLQP